MTAKRIAIALALVAGLSVAGCLLGYILGNFVRANTQVQWTSIGSPPEPPTAFAGIVQRGDYYVVYVQTSSGQLYASKGLDPDDWTKG